MADVLPIITAIVGRFSPVPVPGGAIPTKLRPDPDYVAAFLIRELPAGHDVIAQALGRSRRWARFAIGRGRKMVRSAQARGDLDDLL